MQRTGLAVGPEAVPIEQPEGGIARLLNLGHQHPAADAVDGAGRQKQAVARPGNERVQALGDRAALEVPPQLGRGGAGAEAGINPRIGLGRQDDPGFGLA